MKNGHNLLIYIDDKPIAEGKSYTINIPDMRKTDRWKSLMEDTDKWSVKMAENFFYTRDTFIKESLKNAIPPLKGEITAGKIRWRGISIVLMRDGSCYLDQRGKRISGIFKYKIEAYGSK
jgi:hypothetical protein